MPDNPIAGLYPQPAQPTAPFSGLASMGQAANSLGPLMVGKAMQGALDPATGQIDQNQLLSTLKQNPIGAAQAVPAMDALQKLRSAGYAADQAGLDTFQKRMAVVHHLFSGLASKTTPTMDDVYDTAAQALDPALGAKQHGITLPVVMNTVKVLRDAFNTGGTPALRKKALEIQTQSAATGEILDQHSPRMEAVNQGGQITFVPTGTRGNPAAGTAVPMGLPPTTPIATPEGQRYLGTQSPVPGGGVVGPDGRPPLPQTPPGGVGGPVAPAGPAASLPPGFEAAAVGIGGQSAASANSLTQANDTSMVRKGMLGNLEDDMRKFTTGPGADWTKLAKSWINRNVPVPKSWQDAGGVLDVKSIASQEQFNKQSAMLAQQQFAAIGGSGTDAKFNSAFTTNPNEALSQLGNTGIIRLLKGNEDAIQVKNKEWQAWLKSGKGPNTYPAFSADFNDKFDPRVFQFKYIAPADRQAYVDNMDPVEKLRFLHDLTYARKKGWVNFEQPKAK